MDRKTLIDNLVNLEHLEHIATESSSGEDTIMIYINKEADEVLDIVMDLLLKV